MPPLPPNNPVYKSSLFPNAVDQLDNQPDPETADAIMAIESSLIGGSPQGSAPLVPPLATGLAPGGGVAPGCHLFSGTGVPAAGLGANGDYYLRADGAASAHLYFKSAGAWAGLV